jgi:hypothetical protein
MQITYEQALTGLQKLADERPDYIHTEDPKLNESLEEIRQSGEIFVPKCLYRFNDGTPGCLIGALVADLFPDVRLKEGKSAAQALRVAGIEADVQTLNLLNSAQNEQDAGLPWASALIYAKNIVERKYGTQ